MEKNLKNFLKYFYKQKYKMNRLKTSPFLQFLIICISNLAIVVLMASHALTNHPICHLE